MIPLPLWLYAALGGLLASIGCWFAGDLHGHSVEHDAMQAKINSTIIAAEKVKEDNEAHQRKENAHEGNGFAADASAIAASAAAVDTGGLRFRTCPRVELPQAPSSRPPVDGTGTPGVAASAVATGTVDFADVAREIANLDAERARLAAKVTRLQNTIRNQPGYTDGN